MKGTLISFDERNYKTAKEDFESKTSLLQQIVAAYNVLNLPALSTQEFYSLILNPTEVVFDKMTGGEPVSIAGLHVDKKKAFELLIKPTGYDALLSTIESVFAQLKTNFWLFKNTPVNKNNVSRFFELDSDGNVSMISALDEQVKEYYTYYATSDAAKQANDFVNAFIKIWYEYEVDKWGDRATVESVGYFIDELLGQDSSLLSKNNPIALKAEKIVKYNDNTFYRKG